MIVLSCNQLKKYYTGNLIIDNINFSINKGERIGLVGPNGAGKTTLFKLITEEIPSDSGEIFIAKGFKLGYLLQNTHIDSPLSIYNYALRHFEDFLKQESELRELEKEISQKAQDNKNDISKLMDKYALLSEAFHSNAQFGYDSTIKGIFKGLGFSDDELNRPINLLSGGQKSRVLLGYLLLQNPDILLLDEPTNHLDLETISWLERYLREYKGTVFIISHDRYFLDQTVKKIFYLNNHSIKKYNGNYTNFLEKKKSEDLLLEKQYIAQQREIKRLEEMIQRLGQYGSKRNIHQSQSRAKMLSKIKESPLPDKTNPKAKIKFDIQNQSGRDVLSVENLGMKFDNNEVFSNFNFNVYSGDKIGIIGANGIGKSTLFNIICGKLNATSGSYNFGHQTQVAYYEQEQKQLSLNKTIVEEIWDENPTFDHFQVRSLLARFLFIGDDIFKEIKNLSGGEKARLSLLKLMLSKANVLLMDEPTNHLDMDSKDILEEALIEYNGTLLIISHDRYFLNRVCNKIFEFTPSQIEVFLGNYDYFYEKKHTEIYAVEEVSSLKTKTQLQAEKRKEKEKKSELKKLKKLYEETEENLHQLENDILNIDNLLCSEDVYSDIDKSLELQNNRDNLSLKVDELFLVLIELEDKISNY